MTTAEFTVASDGAAAGGSDSALPTVGSVYDAFNLGSLFGGIDAVSALDPGGAFTAGLDAATAAVSSVDPLAFLGL